MRSKSIRWVGYTTIVLLTLTIMSSLDVAFKWVFSLIVVGQGMLIYMVLLVLKDDYKTEHTFSNAYQDRPIAKEEDLLE